MLHGDAGSRESAVRRTDSAQCHSLVGAGKTLVHYFVNGGEFVNCVCVVEKAGWQEESWVEAGSKSELRADFAGWHDSIQQLLDQSDDGTVFKWGCLTERLCKHGVLIA